ncbi:condensation domain-containing protein (plasmid) [Streptomyces sp. HUAS TT11]|uniref:condensation domain-containing protein n=1 Tax=Streptomyces sp. HUAS TT11 TaxID=3447508 RepID=UPI003F654BA5
MTPPAQGVRPAPVRLPAPLSYGQLSVWRDIEGLPEERRHEANTWARWQVPGDTGVPEVRRALRALGARHPSLHTVYDLTDPDAPRQSVRPDLVGDTETTASEAGPGEVDEVLAGLLARPFNLTGEPGWRAHLVTTGTGTGPVREVLLVKHHMTADGWCDRVLREDFLALLAGDRAEPPAVGPAELAEWQLAPGRERSRAAAVAHWQDVIASGSSGFPGTDPSGRPVLQATVRSHRALRGAQALAERSGTGLSAVVLGAYTLAVARAAGEDAPVVQMMSANRFHPRWRDVVTSMNQWTAARHPVVDDLDEHMRRTHRMSMSAYRHGMVDVDRIARMRALSPGHEPTCAFNFLRLDHPCGPGDADGALVWEEPFSTIGHGCYLRAADEAGVSLALRLRTKGIPRDLAARIVTDVHGLLASAQQ